MKNRLADETSPYLLQHAENPVHWWAWSPVALAEAKASKKPILLSVGYAACHWCHVMAHESFEDNATAEVMNRLFVNIKVDREERPDIDTIYMAALHALGEQGGWPLTMFLTPDGAPFWGGTYFPDTERFGRPSFVRVLNEVSRIFNQEPEKVSMNAKLITTKLREGSEAQPGAFEIGDDLFRRCARQIHDHMDEKHGGLRGAPKFPQYTLLWFMWRAGIRFNTAEYLDAVTLTLDRICQGGIYDHLGGGFARYSVDERWLAPHFEKMLYDNALLLLLLSEAWRETQSALFAERIAETIGWLEREMRMPDGGFASSLDADSEGVEGKFYVWSEDEIVAALGAVDAAFFGSVYDVSAEGNWEGSVILNRLEDTSSLDRADRERLSTLREKLLELRGTRIRPGLDDKVLADWNGLMIAALVQCAGSFDRDDWLALADDAYNFVKSAMTRDGRLVHSWRETPSSAPGFSADYANMILAALELYQATGVADVLEDARRWTAVLDAYFWLDDSKGYAMTADDTEVLIVRTRAAHDDATPNANAIMLGNLVALFQLTGDAGYLTRAEALLASFSGDIARNPIGHTGMMGRAMDLLAPQMLAIVAGREEQPERPFQSVLRQMSLPGMVVHTVADTTHFAAGIPLEGRNPMDGHPTAYFCSGGTCSLPVTDWGALEDLLRAGREASLPAG